MLLDLVFPARCVRCRAYISGGEALCAACRRQLVAYRTFFCWKCRARRYAARGICHRDFPFALAAAGSYEDPIVRALIQELNFRFIRDAARTLGGFLSGYARRLRLAQDYDIIVPIPLSSRRRRERGFNQSELIAQAAARACALPVHTDLLVRQRHAPPQSGLPNDPRRAANIAGAFRIAPGAAARIAGCSIILVDDVITSGATLLEAARALKGAGAERIVALTAAKA